MTFVLEPELWEEDSNMREDIPNKRFSRYKDAEMHALNEQQAATVVGA